MQVKQARECSECGFATLFSWELREHLKATGHRKRRFFTPFSRWIIKNWIKASTTRRITALIISAAYVALLTMFPGNVIPITIVFGLLIWIVLKADSKSSRTD
jgi:hypothetical protein